MRGVGSDVGEEGFVAVGLDELDGLPKPDVGAEPFEPQVLSIDNVGVVKIVVARDRRLCARPPPL